MSNKLYDKTVFVAEEEPTHTKLNALDDRIEAGLQLVANAIVAIETDNVVMSVKDSATELKVTASSPADMYVHIQPGTACVSGTVCQNESANTKLITAPTSSNRYTIVQISSDVV